MSVTIQEIKNLLGGFENRIAQKLDKLDNQVEKLDTRLDAQDETIAKLDKKLEAQTADLKAHIEHSYKIAIEEVYYKHPTQEDFDKVKSLVNDLENEIDDNAKKVTDLKKQLEKIEVLVKSNNH